MKFNSFNLDNNLNTFNNSVLSYFLLLVLSNHYYLNECTNPKHLFCPILHHILHDLGSFGCLENLNLHILEYNLYYRRIIKIYENFIFQINKDLLYFNLLKLNFYYFQKDLFLIDFKYLAGLLTILLIYNWKNSFLNFIH